MAPSDRRADWVRARSAASSARCSRAKLAAESGSSGRVERARAERVGQREAGAGGKIERAEEVEPGAVGAVPRHLELGPHRRVADLAPGLVDGGAYPGADQLAGLIEQSRGDGAVRLTRAHRLDGAQRAEVGESRRGAGDFSRGLGIQPGGHRGVPRGAQPADERRIEDGLRGFQLETVHVERVGHPGDAGKPEFLEVHRLPGIGRAAADVRQQVGSALADAGVGGAHVELGDRGVHALAPPQGDRLQERDGPGRRDRLLRAALLGGHWRRGEQRREREEREAERRAAHDADLRDGPRGGRAPRGGTGQSVLRPPALR